MFYFQYIFHRDDAKGLSGRSHRLVIVLFSIVFSYISFIYLALYHFCIVFCLFLCLSVQSIFGKFFSGCTQAIVTVSEIAFSAVSFFDIGLDSELAILIYLDFHVGLVHFVYLIL